MKNLVYTLFPAGLITILIGLTSCSNHHASNELIVGTSTGFPPYELLDPQGGIIGFDIDVAQKLADKLGKQLVIKDMAYDSLLMSLKQGKIDLILAGVSITKTKLAEIAMVHYQGTPLKSLPLLFWGHVPDGVTTVEDLATVENKTVCAQTGTIQESIIKKYSFLTVKNMENIPDLIMDIKHGKSIAAVLEPSVVTALQQQMPEIKVLDLPLKEDEQGFGNGIGINKSNKKLIEQVQSAIQQMKDDGTLATLEKQWFKGV